MAQTSVDATALGETALAGWRQKLADRIADPLAERTPLRSEHVRALTGAAFFALSLYYVIGTVRRALDEVR